METAVHIVNWLITAAGGSAFTYVATNWGKISSYIPISEGRKNQVRTFAGLMAALSVVVLAFVNPDIRPEDFQSSVLTLLTFVATWLGAHATHKAIDE